MCDGYLKEKHPCDKVPSSPRCSWHGTLWNTWKKTNNPSMAMAETFWKTNEVLHFEGKQLTKFVANDKMYILKQN